MSSRNSLDRPAISAWWGSAPRLFRPRAAHASASPAISTQQRSCAPGDPASRPSGLSRGPVVEAQAHDQSRPSSLLHGQRRPHRSACAPPPRTSVAVSWTAAAPSIGVESRICSAFTRDQPQLARELGRALKHQSLLAVQQKAGRETAPGSSGERPHGPPANQALPPNADRSAQPPSRARQRARREKQATAPSPARSAESTDGHGALE